MQLSVAIIAKNEEASIGRCLESVQGADEIIVVDTGSEDKTVEVAKQYGATVYTDYCWNDNFAEARNHAKSKCKGDWILTIDCDNRLVEGIPAVREQIARAEKEGAHTISLRIVFENGNRFSHYLPYLYRNESEIQWRGAAHNYLTRDDKFLSQLTLSCWHSPAHAKDPDRTFRILKHTVAMNPDGLVREKYYLGREFYVHGDYAMAIYWLEQYLKVGQWEAEMADACLFIAKSHWRLNQGDVARAFALTAIGINTNFREAIEFLAMISGPINKDRWLEFAEGADSSGVLFVRQDAEWKQEQYDQHWKEDTDTSRYDEISKEIARIVGSESVLDIGCGPARLAEFVPNYSGFDFSPVAIERANHPKVWLGSAYDKANFNGAKYYVCTEVLEHLDDFKVIANIPSGKKVIFSVPSFGDPSHLRVFTEKVLRRRYRDLFDFQNITRFNWDGRWVKGGTPTRDYILLAEAVKR